MNIFYLNKDPVVAAQMMCDKHVVKMILESAQMLSSAHRISSEEYATAKGLYKIAHKNHPSTIWVRSSDEHYKWLFTHMIALMEEYTYRYGKHHATERLIEPLRTLPFFIDKNGFVDPPQCMPEECKGNDTVLAYQKYYIVEKSAFATWKLRAIPEWWKDGSDARRILGLHGAQAA